MPVSKQITEVGTWGVLVGYGTNRGDNQEK
jgi:hypothetical protein